MVLRARVAGCLILVCAAWLVHGPLVRAEVLEDREATVEDRVREHGAAARARLRPWFETAGVAYPPRALVLVGLKLERRLELYAEDASGTQRFVRSYPILAASGRLGPKLVAGDLQVPEGIYRVELLNPNSSFHLSLRLGYPNAFDRARAREESREDPGSDIMIHGSSVSAGCLAMGDRAIEDLFVLTSDVGISHMKAILSPLDLRRKALPASLESARPWTPWLYALIRRELAALPVPER